MSNSSQNLPKAIRTEFAPALRADGFSGSRQRFRRVLEGQVQVVEFQGHRGGGSFAVNLGLQPLNIPANLGGVVDPTKVIEPGCFLRTRMTESGADQWWPHDGSLTSMKKSVRQACLVYEQFGRVQLNNMGGTESPLNIITPDDFLNSNYDFFGFGTTRTRIAWGLAHMRKAEGKLDAAKAFAEIALANIKISSARNPRVGSALVSELHALIREL